MVASPLDHRIPPLDCHKIRSNHNRIPSDNLPLDHHHIPLDHHSPLDPLQNPLDPLHNPLDHLHNPLDNYHILTPDQLGQLEVLAYRDLSHRLLPLLNLNLVFFRHKLVPLHHSLEVFRRLHN